MPTQLSSREFNQDIGKAKQAALQGPVIVTTRGKPTYVLLNIQDYQAMIRTENDIADQLAMSDEACFDWEPPRLATNLARPADFN